MLEKERKKERKKESDEAKPHKSLFNIATQVFLPAFTIAGFLFTAIKLPQYGLVFNLIAQVFWLYSSWQAWKKANQIGIFITTLFITIIVLFGIVNYWFL